jgi:hypothetical protein
MEINKNTPKKKRVIITNHQNIIRIKRKPKVIEYIILLHKVGVAGMSRTKASELMIDYKEGILNELNEFGNIRIKNIVVPSDSVREFDIQVLYPTVDSIMDKLKGSLTTPQERKLKIFKLLEEL